MIKQLFYIVLLLFFSFVGIISLLPEGLFIGHDVQNHVTRIIQYHEAIQDGQIPPRWAGKFYGGIGSPVFLVSYHLPYMFAEGIFRITKDAILSFKYVLILSYLLSGLFAYIAFRSIGSSFSAFIASVFYIWSPYRFVDMYVRGALGESVSFMFPPVILYGITKKSLLITIAGIVGILLTHPVAAFGYVIFYFFYSVLNSKQSFLRKETVVGNIFFFVHALIVAICISGFSIMPILDLTRFTQYSFSETFKHFPSFFQLLSSPWGFAESIEGYTDGFSFQIGWVNLIICIAAGVLLIRKNVKSLNAQIFQRDMMYVSFVTISTLVMILPISTPIWKLLSLHTIIDFPWRFLLFLVFFTAYLINWFFSALKTRYATIIGLLSLCLLLSGSTGFNRVIGFLPWDASHYTKHMGTGDSYSEYASEWRVYPRIYTQLEQRLEILQGKGLIQSVQHTTSSVKGTIIADETVIVRINIMYFPGWNVAIDGVLQSIPNKNCRISKIDDSTSIKNNSGLIECTVHKGSHSIHATYGYTFSVLIGMILTICGIVIYIVLCFVYFIRFIKTRLRIHE